MGETAGSVIPDNIASAIRAVFLALGGWLVGKGWMTNDMVQAIVPALMIVVPVIWSFIANHNKKAALQAAINAPAGSSGQ